MSLQNRIKQLFLEHPDKTPADLSRKIKITKTSISDWMSGKTKSINATNAFKVGKYFNVNPEWIATGEGSKYLEKTKTSNQVNEEKIKYFYPHDVKKLTFILWSNIDKFIDSKHKQNDGEIKMLIYENELQTTLNETAFVIQINNSAFDKYFKIGTQLVINTNMTPKIGQTMLITFGDSGPTTLVKYRPVAGKIFFEMLENGYPTTLEITKDTFYLLHGIAVWQEQRGHPID